MNNSSANGSSSAHALAGLSSKALLRFIDSLEGADARFGETLDPHGVCIMRGGEIVWEAAWKPYSLEHAALVYSASKTYASMAIGFCENEGLLSLDDDPGVILGLPNPHGITIRHLLTMNTGHEESTINELGWEKDSLLSTPPEHTPGTHFSYNSQATFVLSCVVTAVTGQRLTEYLRPRLLDPLGIGDRWMRRIRDVDFGASGYHLTVRDLARTGAMLAAGGKDGEVTVVPSAYIEEMQKPWSDNSGAPDPSLDEYIRRTAQENWGAGYGYQVWRSREGIRLDGAYGQFSLIIPERDIVVAYQGATTNTAATMAVLWELIDDWGDAPAQESAEQLEQLVRRAGSLDSWSFSARYHAAPDGELASTRCWREDNGMLRIGLDMFVGLEGMSVPVGEHEWLQTTIEVPGAQNPANLLPLAVRGEEDIDGKVRIHVVVTSSPHRVLATGNIGGELEVAWHTVPLRYETAKDIAVPRVVVDAV